MIWKRWIAVALSIAALGIADANADPVEDFYKGRPLSLVVSYGPGGGYDVYARLVARFMGKYIPGNPSLVVRNMPGAGGLVAANYLYNVAPKDGTTFGLFARNVPLVGLIGGNAAASFDPRKFTWLGSSSSGANDAYLFVARKDAKVQSAADARRPGGPPLIVGSTTGGDSAHATSLFFRDLLGFNLQVVAGYPDGAALYLALERSEIEARMVGYSSVKSSRPNWIKPDGIVRVLAVMGRATRHPDLPDAPTARELAGNERDRQLVDLMNLPYLLSRPYAAPPDVPAERAKALQDAFLAAHKDPEFLVEAEKLRVDVSPISGAEVSQALERIAATDPELMKSIEKFIVE